ncbi:SGNH/GDSL hydrolase family protein [Mycobacterium sp. SM1]|uniref:SGNH/GDSL hydrolase family protein n=1 Tax=Mycobacterium sp. SM1 TaxID=2816243 RepID=UPI001BCA94EB|nr:SGNH/GDSL hydrolase family protein [Mycobacterium sp. SM1]MBS4730668.1 SGNH/GDSL hydrolase family protein [Mycobacterium sp. SM1]
MAVRYLGNYLPGTATTTGAGPMATLDVTSRPAADGGGEAPRPRHRIRAVLFRLLAVVLTVAATMGAVEAVFRVLGYRPLYDVYAKPDNFYVADRLVGWSYGPGATGEFVGPRPFPITFRTHIRINSLGLRGPELTPVAPGGLRVLVLGDSVASGLEVAENETYSAVAAGLLSQRLGVSVQVVNAGVRGYGTDQEWLLYRERLKPLHPDVVLVHETANDPDDNVTLHRMRRVFGKPAFILGPDDTLHLVGQPVPDYPRCSEYRVMDDAVRRADGARARTVCRLQLNLANHSAFFSFVAERLQRNPALVAALYNLGSTDDEAAHHPPVGAPASPQAAAGNPGSPPAVPAPPPATPYAQRLTSVLISRMADDVRRDGARFVLMGQDFDLQKLDMPAFEQQGIPLIRIDAALVPENLIPNDGHPNATGHHQIAELLTDQIEPLLREVLEAKAFR